MTLLATTFGLPPQDVLGWRESEARLWYSEAVKHRRDTMLEGALAQYMAMHDPEQLRKQMQSSQTETEKVQTTRGEGGAERAAYILRRAQGFKTLTIDEVP